MSKEDLGLYDIDRKIADGFEAGSKFRIQFYQQGVSSTMWMTRMEAAERVTA